MDSLLCIISSSLIFSYLGPTLTDRFGFMGMILSFCSALFAYRHNLSRVCFGVFSCVIVEALVEHTMEYGLRHALC